MRKLYLLFPLAVLANQISFAQISPNISYNLTNVFTLGDNIGIIKPSNSGGNISVAEVTTFAGNGTNGSQNGLGNQASFNVSQGMAIDPQGNIYVVDVYNHQIRKISPTGAVTTFAGSGVQKFEDGTGTNASFNIPIGLVCDSSQNLYVVDSFNNRIRKITPTAIVSTIAGTAIKGSTDGTGISSSF
ncbi:NHL repeat-containing protein [Flavobacterium chryseum]|uniref:hypothetical protein n=1 Tax=Flavobacterium sp. P3160 TaxID=2512113 RepID=UPI00105E25D1|nr:hypothetical protein [Flavobacterium sp. P3160]TDO68943.1 NHL repeat-containing protein [Flavobacterium sp. P3160]